jgi:hypothetical protein
MFDCIVFCGPETVVERDPQLLSLALYTLSTGGLGMLLARRRPVLSALFISFVLLSAFAVYLEVRACYVGESILRMSGYISGSALVILVGISLSVLGALVGAQKVDERTRAWRWTSGLSGIALLGLTLFAGYQLGRTAYREYFVWYPKIRARNHYVLGWRDILPHVITACVLTGLLFLGSYLLRCALRFARAAQIQANS